MSSFFRNMPLTLYIVTDGPPSLAVMQMLKYLELDYNLVKINFGAGEQMTEEFEKVSFRYLFISIYCIEIHLGCFTEKSSERATCIR